MTGDPTPPACDGARRPPPDWRDLGPVGDFEAAPMRAVRVEGRRLVVGRAPSGWFAVDGRCPHEGYPLETGTLSDCVLTCEWHNWKFDVRDGRCLVGGEDVRRYPIEEREGRLFVDVSEPPAAERIPALVDGLLAALRRGDLGRALREAVRALDAGAEPAELLGAVAADACRRGEWGPGHTLPLAGLALGLVEDGLVDDPVRALAPVLELSADTLAWRPAHERPRAPESPPAEGDALRRALLAAVEEERLADALALLAGALRGGLDARAAHDLLVEAASIHFTDLGHELIYLEDARDLFLVASGERLEDLACGVLRAIVFGTREDRLPYLRPYFQAFENAAPEPRDEAASLVEAALDAPRPADAAEALAARLACGADPRELARDLSEAAALRLLRFDERHDADPTVHEGWLHATHRLTFASAVRRAVDRLGDGEVARRFLLQALAFVHSGAPLDAPPGRRRPPISGEEGDILAARRPALVERALASPFVRPIFTAHGIKTVLAALDEHRALAGRALRGVPLQAALRFLEADVVERPVERLLVEAVRFVREGRVPRKLTQ